jgi:hypothetical protein
MRNLWLICMLLFAIAFYGQTCQWAKSCDAFSESHSVCTDKYGNVFMTGWFVPPSITFGTYTLTNSSGGPNVYLVKYDSNGNVLWAKSGIGTGNSYCAMSVEPTVARNAAQGFIFMC